MRFRSKKLCVLSAFALAHFVLVAEPITIKEAVKAAENWIAEGNALGTPLSPTSVGAQTYLGDDGGNAVHVVSLDGGGFVVTSTDDAAEPILAYSGTGSFDAVEGSPLAALLASDIMARKAANEQANAGSSIIFMSTLTLTTDDEASTNKSKWNRLLGRDTKRGMTLMSSSGLSSVATVRVAPLVQSKWSQSKVSTGKCYNYYTPKGYVCGCVATAMAQVMRYHRHPTAYITPQKVKCSVDDVSQSLTMKGGTYDWANMPLDPYNATSAQREAIGKLTYDCGVAVGMSYSSSGSGAYTEYAATALKSTFGYYSADYKSRPNITVFHSLVTNNLHQSRPVLLGISGSGGHAIVADGYGLSSGAIYYHLNMGWAGQDDLWYNLPTVTTASYSFNTIRILIYDIKPTKSTVIKPQTLAEAVDNTSLTFTTGGDAEWYYQKDVTHDSEDAARSGKIGNSQYTWMRTTVEGSGMISFWWKCNTGSSILHDDDVDFRIDGTNAERIYGDKGWRRVIKTIKGNGVHTLDWVYTKDSYGAMISRADCAWVDQVEWTPMVTVTLDAQGGTVASNELFLARNDYNGYGYSALPTPTWMNRTFLGWYTAKVGGTHVYWWSPTPSRDTTLYAHWEEDRYYLGDDDAWLNPSFSQSYFYTGGDAQWTEVSSPTTAGSFAFKSGTIGHGKTNWMEKTVSGPGRVTFYWRPSSEMDCDICMFSVDGEEQRRISGVSNNWTCVNCAIDDSGEHTLRWTYAKDGNTVKGSDCVWVDDIKWQPQVSVTLDGNGGTTYGWISWGVKKYVGDRFSYLPSPSRTGYRFDGWFSARNGGERVDANTVVTASLTVLYAHWLQESALAGALNTALAVTTGGSSTWFGQTSVSHDGVDAACSGRLSYGQSNWMEISTTGAGRLRFAWAIDGYTYDSLALLLDGDEQMRISGRQDWTEETMFVGSGSHTFRWGFSKNGASSVGADCAWVDRVAWEPETYVFLEKEGGSLSQTWYRGYVGDIVELPTPTRTGYTFKGWYTERDGGEKVDGTLFTLDRTRSLYAHWGFSGATARGYRDSAVYLTWGLTPEAVLYSVYRSSSEDFAAADWLCDWTYRWYFDYAANPGDDYWYWVVATDSDGNHAHSNAAKGHREVHLVLEAYENDHGSAAESGYVGVTANTSWKAESSVSWLKLTAAKGSGNGKLSYAVQRNFSPCVRAGTITVTAGGDTDNPKVETITISQAGIVDLDWLMVRGGTTAYTTKKARTMKGALYTVSGAVYGTVVLKLGPVNSKKKVKVSGTVCHVNGKKYSIIAKTVKIQSGTPTIAKLKIKTLGTLEVAIGGDGIFGLIGKKFIVQTAKVGGNWTKDGAALYVDFGDGEKLPENTLIDLLPLAEPIYPSSGKWAFAKTGIKTAKRSDGTYKLTAGKEVANPAAVKIAYTPSTGAFKGTFRIYTGTAATAKMSTVAVTGVVVDGSGIGRARLKKPAATWIVVVDVP